jgi:hypothetical protein
MFHVQWASANLFRRPVIISFAALAFVRARQGPGAVRSEVAFIPCAKRLGDNISFGQRSILAVLARAWMRHKMISERRAALPVTNVM